MMKKALKVTFGAILAAGTLGTAQANMADMFDHVGAHVTGTYSKASNNGMSYGDTFVAFPTAAGGGRFGQPVFVGSKHDWDWGAGLMYGFSEHTSLYFNYEHYSDGSDSNAVNVRNLGVSAPLMGAGNPVSTAATGHSSNKTNEYELGLAHKWAQSPKFCIDYKAQLQWDTYDREFYETNDGDNGDFARRTTTNSFKGFGPGVGLMAHARPLSHCPTFGLFAGGVGSAMYGKNEFSSVAVNQATFLTGVFPDNSHSIVGKLDVKFGVDYVNNFAMDGCKIPYGLALGMRYMNAFNVFKNGNTYAGPLNVSPTGAIASDRFTFLGSTANDFGRFGPFLTFNVGGVA